MRASWIAGDFGALTGEICVPEAERFVARLGLEPGALLPPMKTEVPELWKIHLY